MSLDPRLVALVLVAVAPAQSKREPVSLPELPQSLYYVIPARSAAKEGVGRGLLVVLPGGDGSTEFLAWVETIATQTPEDFITVLVTAPKWDAKQAQEVVWPLAATGIASAKYTTETYVNAVVDAVAKQDTIDPARMVLLTWSSSGPVAWAMALQEKALFARYYVAMSIFPRASKDQLRQARGKRFFLDQSPDDQTTRFAHAEAALKAISSAGAATRLVTYAGGHGFVDEPLPRLREGLRWLLSNEPAPAPGPIGRAPTPPAKGDNLLRNGSFEAGIDGWNVIDNSDTLKVAAQKGGAKDGKHALHMSKTGKLPLDLVRQDIARLPPSGQVVVRAWVKCKDSGNAFVKFFLLDDRNQPVHAEVDLVQLRGDKDWTLVEKAYDVGKATRAALQVVMVLGGEVWVDGAEVRVAAGKR